MVIATTMPLDIMAVWSKTTIIRDLIFHVCICKHIHIATYFDCVHHEDDMQILANAIEIHLLIASAAPLIL